VPISGNNQVNGACFELEGTYHPGVHFGLGHGNRGQPDNQQYQAMFYFHQNILSSSGHVVRTGMVWVDPFGVRPCFHSTIAVPVPTSPLKQINGDTECKT
jgi:hypothetical protein